jgi:hypothetical protein
MTEKLLRLKDCCLLPGSAHMVKPQSMATKAQVSLFAVSYLRS